MVASDLPGLTGGVGNSELTNCSFRAAEQPFVSPPRAMADDTKFLLLFLLLSSSSLCSGSEQDIRCLKSVQESLADPGAVLKSWDFENDTNGYICRFIGVECWHPDENRILSATRQPRTSRPISCCSTELFKLDWLGPVK